MKTIYTILSLLAVLAVILFTSSFLYFESTSHQVYDYAVYENSALRGYLEVHKYNTQESIIYISREAAPYDRGVNSRDTRLTINAANSSLKDFEIRQYSYGISETYLLKSIEDRIIFLAQAKSRFLYYDKFTDKKKLLPFGLRDISTWWPLVKTYRFAKGGAQSFSVLKYSNKIFLPKPVSVMLTSIRDEYVTINRKKIKAECLILSEGGVNIASIWVSKSNHDVLAVESSDKRIKYELTDAKKPIVAKRYTKKSAMFVEKQVTFESCGRDIPAVLTRPKTRGSFPVAILVCGDNSVDEDNEGLFADIAAYLAEKNFVVLRYNRSDALKEPKVQTLSVNDEKEIFKNAVSMLEDFRFVDITKIACLAHGNANAFMPGSVSADPRIKAYVMLSPETVSLIKGFNYGDDDKMPDRFGSGDENYQRDLIYLLQQVIRISNETDGNYKKIMGNRVYLERVKEVMRLKPLEDLKALEIPVLVINPGDEESLKRNFCKNNYEQLQDMANITVIDFNRKNPYMGKLVSGELFVTHYEADADVLESIRGWLDLKLNVKTDAGSVGL